jgi:hypothetical protein
MFDRFRNHRWYGLEFRLRKVRPITRIPWSAIRRIGQSRLLSLTIIVPFLGSLILFNAHVVEFLTLSPELIARFFPRAGLSINEAAKALTLQKLYYVYFGLSVLGLASGIFVLLCPLEIKSFDSFRSYLAAESDLASKSRMGLILPNIAKDYLLWTSDDSSLKRSRLTRVLGQPEEFSELFIHVITTIWESMVAERYLGPISAEKIESGEDQFLDHRGRPKVSYIAEILYGKSTVTRGVVYSLQELSASESIRKDVLALQYIALDHSKPWLRVAVAFLYGVGFLLLLIPTAMTFARVIKSLL